MLGRILRASILRRILGGAEFWRILRSCCVEKILSGCPVEKDPEGLPCWEGFSRPLCKKDCESLSAEKNIQFSSVVSNSLRPHEL